MPLPVFDLPAVAVTWAGETALRVKLSPATNAVPPALILKLIWLSVNTEPTVAVPSIAPPGSLILKLVELVATSR